MILVYQVACSDLPIKGRTKDAQFTTQSTSLLITNTVEYSSTRFQQSEDLHPTTKHEPNNNHDFHNVSIHIHMIFKPPENHGGKLPIFCHFPTGSNIEDGNLLNFSCADKLPEKPDDNQPGD
jgi:hypothetical protein